MELGTVMDGSLFADHHHLINTFLYPELDLANKFWLYYHVWVILLKFKLIEKGMLSEATSNQKYVDLHIHTIFSDGSSTVKEVFEAASAKGLKAISITDHDCTDAYPLCV